MKTPPASSRFPRGSAMLFVLAFCIMGGIAVTAWVYLIASRSIQAERMTEAVQRRLFLGNTAAANQQYTVGYAFRDNATQADISASLGDWGGMKADAFKNLAAWRTVNTGSATTLGFGFPFLNVRRIASADGATFCVRSTAATDATQTEHTIYYNYEKTYPLPLLGDLIIVHKTAAGATTGASFAKNIRADGRVLIYDENAVTGTLKAQECLNLTKRGTNTTLNSTGASALMPQNFASKPIFSAGSGPSSSGPVLDGTLDMVDNPDFTPGSIRSIVENSGSYTSYPGPVTNLLGVVTGLIGGVVGGLVDLTSLSSTLPNPVQIQRTYLTSLSLTNIVGTTLPNILPPFQGNLGLLNIGIILANHPNLTHVQMTGTVDIVIVLGQLVPLNLSQTASLKPVILWIDQSSKPRHVIFIGASQRPLIFVTGTGDGRSTYAAFVGVQSLLGAPLPWRLHWINEGNTLQMVPPLLFGNLQWTGSLRTNASVLSTDTGTTDRFIIQRDSSAPATLVTLMPRDGWLETIQTR